MTRSIDRPAVRWRAVDLARKWEELLAVGVTDKHEAAQRIGVRWATLDRALHRARHYRARTAHTAHTREIPKDQEHQS
jgi:hypothetical protein